MAEKNVAFTKVPNAVLEMLYRSKLNGREFRVMLFVIRHTYGFQHEEWKMSNTFIANGLGIARSDAKDLVLSLERKHLLHIARQGRSSKHIALLFEGGGELPSIGRGETTPIGRGKTTSTSRGELTSQINKDIKKDKKSNSNNNFSSSEDNPYFFDYAKLRKEMGL